MCVPCSANKCRIQESDLQANCANVYLYVEMKRGRLKKFQTAFVFHAYDYALFSQS
jgi:hypothetical protein